MKLNRVNTNGSLSVIIPKQVVKSSNWKEGQELNILANNRNCIIFSRKQDNDKAELETIISEINTLQHTFNNLPEFMTQGTVESNTTRTLLKQRLLSIIEKIG